VVTTQQNFDSLLFPKDHVARSASDNYYVNSSLMLRAHTSAHQADFISQGLDAFLIAGDVYRRDEIDRSHYPVFHQMEGVRLFSPADLREKIGEDPWREGAARDPLAQEEHSLAAAKYISDDLKSTLEGSSNDFTPLLRVT
jgi:phenylalanyl-tRNA synthetase alpha chain